MGLTEKAGKLLVIFRPECIKKPRINSKGAFLPNMECKCKYQCKDASLLLTKQRKFKTNKKIMELNYTTKTNYTTTR